MTNRMQAALVAIAAVLSLVPGRAMAAGTLQGTTTTQNQSVRLPGVAVAVMDLGSKGVVTVVVSDDTGRFRVPGLRAGRLQLVARLAGFSDLVTGPLVLQDDRTLEVSLDLTLAPVTQTVDVTADALRQTATAASADAVRGRMLDVLPVEPDGVRSALPVLPGVVRAADGRISLKGGRPTQGGLQVGRGYANDPSTGNFGIELPTDAIETVQVVSNPYGAEDGRFSSSIVKVETRAGASEWHATANRLIPLPCLTLCDGVSMGIRHYEPRVWFGGPIIKDRLFIAQGLEYKNTRIRIPSLPEEANDMVSRSFDAFTRVDATLGTSHRLTATLAVFPRSNQFVNLNTFNPTEVTPDFRLKGYSLAASETAMLSPATVLESSFSASRYDATVSAQGAGAMVLAPDGNRGQFFNTHDRRTRVVQWSESLSWLHQGRSGEHLLKVGADVMRASYTGTSESRPVLVVRADGTLSQRIAFGAPTAQASSSTDVAVFAQDRWRVSNHLLIEPGVRFDRDGVTRRSHLSPRISLVSSMLSNGVAVLRGGLGMFFERTPLNVGAFESFEAATVARFAADGVTEAGAPVTYAHRTLALQTPRSVIWNIEYDHRIGANLLVKVNHLRRYGSREALVEPVGTAGSGELRLDSRGRSRYVETEVSARYGASDARHVTVSYVRSRATADLNAFDLFYGNFRDPVVPPNQYSRAPTDVPHRLIVKGAIPVWGEWTVSPLVEIRSGFPYSAVNQDREFVGLRNTSGRFPVLRTFDLNILRPFRILGWPVIIGFRGSHLFNTFSPRDVQANVDSRAFGYFYNSFPRRVAFTVQFLSR